MAEPTIRIVAIEGLDKAVAKLTAKQADGPIGRYLDRGAIYIQSKARDEAPVDTGRLRGSIGYRTVSARMREVGANTQYAEWVETGTRPHWPPPGSLAGWAGRHGLTDYQARYAIAMGGTTAHPYMKPAADSGEGVLKTLIPTLAAEIEAAYGDGS